MKTESSWNSGLTVNLPDSAHESIDSKIYQFTARVVKNRPISPLTYRLELSLSVLDSFRILPGQFFMIRTSPGFDPLLRRPFSILSMGHLSEKGQRRLSILFQAVGQGTRLMAGWTQGKPVDMIGPLGRGYTLPGQLGTVVMIAGGLGIASLFGLAESILLRGKRCDVRVYIGGKSKEDILMKSELESMGVRVKVTTEDGSMGTKGVVTHLLEMDSPHLAKNGNTVVYACGPLEMLAGVASITQKVSLPCQVSLETRMACGVGSCLGCVVRTRDKGYQLVCKEGPVFDARKIDWERTERLI